MKNRSRNNSIDSISNKRSRNNSIDSISNKSRSRSNSIEFNVKSSSEKSTRSYSIGSIESISLEDDDWTQNMDIDNNRKYNDNFINKSPPQFLYNKNKNNIFVQQDKKCRKRDVYSPNICESPKPSKFIEYMKHFLKK